MKPIRLAMQAFCSYAGETVIPFDRLGGRGLYLITGNTGAGKTTIFDAICFALYGVASGEARRDDGLLRSSLAPPDRETYVEFTFEHLGRIYTVRRSPKYERPKKRGEGMIREESRACLTLPGGRVVEKLSAVNEEIEGILRLPREHFSRIAMIAQGDFAKLLLAKVDERRQILQSIFGTQLYEAVQAILLRRARALEEAWRAEKRAIAAECGKLRLPPERDGAALEALSSEEASANLDAWYALAQSVADEDGAALRENGAHRAGARARSEDLVRRRAEAERIRADYDALAAAAAALSALAREEAGIEEQRLEARRAEAASGVDADAAAWAEASAALNELTRDVARAEEALSALEARRPALSTALAEAEARREEAQAAERGARAVREQLPRYREISGMDQQIETLRRALDGALGEAQAAAEEEARLKRLKEEAVAERDALSDVEGALGALGAEVETAGKLLTALEKLQKELSDFEADGSRLVRAQTGAKAALEEAEARSQAHRRLYNAFQLGQAGLMAAALAEGEPCPVCGSTRHPHKASLSGETPAQAQVEAAEAAFRRAKADAEEAVTAAAVLRAERDKEWQRLEADWRECHEDDAGAQPLPAPNARAAADAARGQRERLAGLTRRRSALEGQSRRLRELRKIIPEYERGMDEARERSLKAQRLYAEASVRCESLAQKRGDAAQSLPAATEAEALALAARLEGEYARWSEAIGGAAEALKACDEGIAAAKGALSALEARRPDQERKEKDRREAFSLALARAGFAGEGEYREARRTPEALAVLRGDVDAYDEARRTANQEAGRLRQALEGKPPTDMEALAREEGEAAVLVRALEDERLRLGVRIESNGALMASLAQRSKAYARLSDEYAMVKSLSDAAGGKSIRDDGGRQSLELYVLSELFDEVILFANQRFSEMTGGQYELAREESYRNRKSAFGLDLNVLDHFTGALRPVNTLSGGESFMASLSLALGFADVISARAGGVTLDAMFVDEGFGTLDETALGQVMGALGKLAEGDKLIGLISHVAEMKRRIDRQIVVKKDRQGGSRAEVLA